MKPLEKVGKFIAYLIAGLFFAAFVYGILHGGTGSDDVCGYPWDC